MEKISLKFCLCSLQFKLLASVKMPRPEVKKAGAGPGIENLPGPGGRVLKIGRAGYLWPGTRPTGAGAPVDPCMWVDAPHEILHGTPLIQPPL